MIKETTEGTDGTREEHKHGPSVPIFPVYPQLVCYSYRTEHITPIPPNRAVHRLTVCRVNRAEIRLSSSPGVSSDPEQKDMFWSYRCQRASENSATPFILLFLSLSPCLLQACCFQKKTKCQTNSEQKESSAGGDDTQTFSRYRSSSSLSFCLPGLYLVGASLSG